MLLACSAAIRAFVLGVDKFGADSRFSSFVLPQIWTVQQAMRYLFLDRIRICKPAFKFMIMFTSEREFFHHHPAGQLISVLKFTMTMFEFLA